MEPLGTPIKDFTLTQLAEKPSKIPDNANHHLERSPTSDPGTNTFNA